MAWGSLTVRSFVLGSILGSSKRTGAPATLYFGLLYAAAPTTTLGTETAIGTNSYARVAITNDDSLWTIVDGVATNDVEIRWPASTGAWNASPLNQWAIYDAASAGNCWGFGGLTTAIDVTVANRLPVAAIGALTLNQAA